MALDATVKFVPVVEAMAKLFSPVPPVFASQEAPGKEDVAMRIYPTVPVAICASCPVEEE